VSDALGEGGEIARGEGGQVGACQRGLDEGVGGVFSGEGLEPASEIQRQVTYDLKPQ